MNLIGIGQGFVLTVLGVAALGLEVWALIEAARFRKDAYTAAGKQTKVLWVALTAAAAALGFVLVFNPLNFLSVIAVAIAAIFLTSVRPALRSVQGPGGRTSGGPYGGW
ncbi:Protein of unknown function [Quadrisphaera granulorum]|uniref:Uncharacterized protein DUF2516 n=1 Tax=Quadrisphaera granulorum TaxID=317664 RepID=A0A316A1M7_9ACTN|nr:DUF2516 family protein [Quadrisphaera granulorum]PWJ51751.1 uncharacterized protein DUF2516 [Quadrisphaera granulorum]SZE97698.1 Protein of unknown function [Quadrisphaera granulorum]